MDSYEIHPIDARSLFPQLGEIPKCPDILFTRGVTDFIEGKKLLAVVGSRNCTSYGKFVCQELIRGLQSYPIVIVSGLALGIDSIAHEAALENNIPTIAFPGSGLDRKVLYPARHLSLAERILTAGGALISEYKPHTKAALWTFPERNRLMAGVADMVLTIEAEKQSGTLITSRLATEYNKTVGAVPGNITSPNSKGTNWLLSLGAVPILSSTDIIRELGLTEEARGTPEIILTSEEQKLLELLVSPQSRDSLAETSGYSISELNQLLSILEIKGCIRESIGLIERIT